MKCCDEELTTPFCQHCGKAKVVGKYRIRWSLDVTENEGGTITVPAGDVEGMSDEERAAYFQQCVDEKVRINGPCGFVDSVEEIA